MTPEEALAKIGAAVGLSPEESTPENCVIYTYKAVDTRDRAMDTVRRRQAGLAQALGVGEDVLFPRLIAMIKDLR